MQTSHQVLRRATRRRGATVAGRQAAGRRAAAVPSVVCTQSSRQKRTGEEDISVLVIKFQVFLKNSNVLAAELQISHQVLCRTTI